MRLCVVGGSGFLGSELCRQARLRNWSVTATRLCSAPPADLADDPGIEWRTLDLRQPGFTLDALTGANAVVNAAYVQDGDDVRAVTTEAPAALAAATPSDVPFVHISTDLVFAGDRSMPYTETDAPSPIHDYGRAKADAESGVLLVRPDATIVRTSLLYGFPRTGRIEQDILDAAAGNKSMTFYTDEIRCPTHVTSLARAVLEQVISPNRIEGPLHLTGSEPMNRATFARRIARAYGQTTRQMRYGPRPVGGSPRPKHVVLESIYSAEMLGIAPLPADE